ncbi:hypothetical protein Acsp06_19590 [Actinomycetospora sp. NBRC 106375]|nr:hypothetical protein Acsp06_19590 [Actinomycetospora sp. NBRC 106375]
MVAVVPGREVVGSGPGSPTSDGDYREREEGLLREVLGAAAGPVGRGVGVETGGADLAARPSRRAAHATAPDSPVASRANARVRRSAYSRDRSPADRPPNTQ